MEEIKPGEGLLAYVNRIEKLKIFYPKLSLEFINEVLKDADKKYKQDNDLSILYLFGTVEQVNKIDKQIKLNL